VVNNQSQLNSDGLGFKVSIYKLPVNETAEGFDILGSGVSIIDVIGMFPYINSQNWLIAVSERVAGIGSAHNS